MNLACLDKTDNAKKANKFLCLLDASLLKNSKKSPSSYCMHSFTRLDFTGFFWTKIAVNRLTHLLTIFVHLLFFLAGGFHHLRKVKNSICGFSNTIAEISFFCSLLDNAHATWLFANYLLFYSIVIEEGVLAPAFSLHFYYERRKKTFLI